MDEKREENLSSQALNANDSAESRYICKTCGIQFAKKFNRDRHVAKTHNNIVQVYDCTFCGAIFNSVLKLQIHRERHNPSTGFEEKKSAFKNKCVRYRKTYDKKMLTFENAFNDDRSDMNKLLTFEVAGRKFMKVGIIYHVEFAKLDMHQAEEEKNIPQLDGADDTETSESEEENNLSETEIEAEPQPSTSANSAQDMSETVYEVCLRAPSATVTQATNLHHMIQNSGLHIQNRIDDWVENGSGWRLNAILCVDVEIGNCSPLNGSCNLISIKFLKSLSKTSRSKEMQQCFLQACAFHFTKKCKGIDLFIKKYFITKIKTPVRVNDIPKFERDNKHLNLKINVIYLEGKNLYPILFSKNIRAKHHITLLLYKTKVEGHIVNHYAYVSDVSKLLRKTYQEVGQKRYYKRTINCLNCFTSFTDSQGGKLKLKQHFKLCCKNAPQAVKIPKEGEKIEFRNYVNKFQSYFVGFFDFESCHRKLIYECQTCKIDKEKSNETKCTHKTLTKAIQEPITCSYLIMDKYEKVIFQDTFTDKDCVKRFLEKLIEIEPLLQTTLNQNEAMCMSENEKKQFKNSTHCHICEMLLNEDSVRDHCHITGQYLGAAHSLCNLRRKEQKMIPMFCHNLTGYDGHFLMQKIGDIKGIKTLTALPYNTEKMRTITMNSYQMKDSLSFLNASLNELMNNLLLKKEYTFPIIDQLGLYRPNEIHKKNLILRKGVYPYEYVTSINKLRNTLKIPAKRHFFSSLTNSDISDKDYEHSKKVFKTFGCKNMISYTELYCAIDVGILASVVSQFRKLVQDNFNLDCCHYISTPQLSFDCMLKMTKVKIDLLNEVDQILFIEQNIRGGVSYINQRHCIEEKTPGYNLEMQFIDGSYRKLFV